MPSYLRESLGIGIVLLVIGIPTFVFWHWLFKRNIKDDKTRKLITWVVELLTTPVLYFGIISLFLLYLNYQPSHTFTKERWSIDKQKRYELFGDIIKSKMLIGKTKSEVINLLGMDQNNIDKNRWTYYLGITSGLGIDPDILEIEFKEGKVIRVRQRKT